ncbi:type 2 lanthipeptide synthetase LanM family protein [Thermoactinomyces sp. DSM 45892]|uniref:type 2 lanthipeptide synthetase LanM family protein n=1 Tax=Thermoactinomyces sp. DSM 45892 TaxID=1882753 RepID=UPI0008983EAE|nr:type 2 lanthipeptide synthetase LanM family protein [Thermoactinomyces sp. DSM 45892]SDZ16232.1 type 2 lantibiotic biosynthesis protein LanM [Thermoactinomyces sp. DSM 45892]
MNTNFRTQLYRSLILKERIDHLPNLGQRKVDSIDAEKVIHDWKNVSFLDEKTLEKRLAATNLDMQRFESVLHEMSNDHWVNEMETLDHSKFPWMDWLDEALQLNRMTPIPEDIEIGLQFTVRPFVLWAKKRLTDYFGQISEVDPYIQVHTVLDSILGNLVDGLNIIAGRTFVLELHIEREMEQLEGDTPEARFHSFIQKKIMNPDHLEFIYSEYPTLARLLMIRTNYFMEAIIEAITRYLNDRKQILQEFNIQDKPLTAISAGMGDSHQRCRTVMHFQFESEQVIYKPKDLTVSNHFHQVLDWLNERGFTPPLSSYKVLNKNHYAWEEVVTQKGCSSTEEVQRFYTRFGGLLAVVYSLYGIDFHYENMIANGENPILIDLETLFHNSPSPNVAEEMLAQVKANDRLANSVLKTALLPLFHFSDKDGKGIDVSGLGGREQEYPTPILQVEEYGTDQMRYVRKNAVLRLSGNLPRLHDQLIDIKPYVEYIVSGFKQACQLIQVHQVELLSDKGPIASFKQDTVRIVLRNTQFYADFLLETQHPDYLEDSLEREKLLDRLWFTQVHDKAIPYEIEDLLEGDIPLFTAMVDDTDLYSSTGKIIPNFFKESSYQRVVRRIKSLTPDEIERQASYITASILGGIESKTHLQIKQYDFTPDPIKHTNLPVQSFVEEAEKIGSYFSKKAIHGDKNDVTWIGLAPTANNLWTIAPMDFGLYNGVCGMALFYSYLDQICKNREFGNLAKAALQTACNAGPLIQDTNAFVGQSSILYTLSHMTALYGEKEEWMSSMKELLPNVEQKIEKDQHFDLIYGGAGIIHVLLNMAEQFNWEHPLLIAQKIGHHLIKHAIQTDNGVAWHTGKDKALLGGFSHGTSGIAWSLLRLANVSGHDKYREWGLKALHYDRSLYDESTKNWRDIRHEKGSSSPVQWCHGAPGVGLGRVLCLPYLPADPYILDEIATSVETTSQEGIGFSHSLCHGDLGNADLLLMAGISLKREDWIKSAQSIGHNVIQTQKELGKYLTGVSHFLETPSLFLGLSGIGYQLLRLAYPDQVPSVVSLQSPFIK